MMLVDWSSLMKFRLDLVVLGSTSGPFRNMVGTNYWGIALSLVIDNEK